MSADQEWEEYKTKFNKSYRNQDEEQWRRKCFFENKARVEAHNKRFAAKEVTYSMEVNAFSDISRKEHDMLFGSCMKK